MSMMHLVYVPMKNFGDQLNPWIWKKLLDKDLIINENNCPRCPDDQILTGVNLLSIGSYLHSKFLARFTTTKKAIIAGTGCGYGVMSHSFSWGFNFPYSKPKVNFKLPVSVRQDRYSNSKRFYWVRGPLTAHILGLPKDTAVADGAYLLRQVIPRENCPKKEGIAFMPHISSAQLSSWQEICNKIGFNYIDPRQSRETILRNITKAEVLITDALHGAIVSDALRTPWIPVKTSQNILDFKWRDYCSSIGLDYKPIELPSLWSTSAIMDSQRSLPKKILFGARTKVSNLLTTKEKIANELLYSAYSKSYLSSDKTISLIDERLEYLVNQIKLDMKQDSFFNSQTS